MAPLSLNASPTRLPDPPRHSPGGRHPLLDLAAAGAAAERSLVAAVRESLLRGADGEVRQALDLAPDRAAYARVWQALCEIPQGETRSYGDVARAIGEPTAARAVARACATNRVSVVIPCHRVVASDGSPSGYRWGVKRKKALLEREGARP